MAGQTHDDIDHITGTATTGHEWDGIKELNTPLPKWWVNIFYATIIWAVGYYVAYPSWPGISSHLKGVLGYSSRAEVAADLEDLKALRAKAAADLAKAEVTQIKADPKMLALALAQGKAAFGDNCAPCHGTGGAGAKGYPNLNDDDWLWGGKLTDIYATLQHGVRSTNDADTRISAMPAFGKDGILKKEEIRSVANYVVSLSGGKPEASADLKAGAKLFGDNCASCHGDKGAGNLELGAPNLTDQIWLYGGKVDDVVESVTNSRSGVMPAWAGRLDATTIKSLAVYVHSLGGGK